MPVIRHMIARHKAHVRLHADSLTGTKCEALRLPDTHHRVMLCTTPDKSRNCSKQALSDGFGSAATSSDDPRWYYGVSGVPRPGVRLLQG